MKDDREQEPTPDELRQHAAEARERAKRAEEADKLADDAIDALKELADHSYVSNERTHQLDLLINMLNAIRHGEQWGYEAFHLDCHADNLESTADLKERSDDP